MIPMPAAISIDDLIRFWSKVDKNINGCWLWIGSHSDKNGFHPRPSFRLQGTMYQANRVAYYLEHRIDPGELRVCHTCDRPSCVKPDHLWLGTQSENCLDCSDKGRLGYSNAATIFEEDVLEIRKLRKEGWLYRELAVKYRLSISHIGLICRYKSWQHVK